MNNPGYDKELATTIDHKVAGHYITGMEKVILQSAKEVKGTLVYDKTTQTWLEIFNNDDEEAVEIKTQVYKALANIDICSRYKNNNWNKPIN